MRNMDAPLRKRALRAVATAAAAMLWLQATGSAGDEPILRVPKMTAPPAVDGVIGAEEWAGASCLTGLSNYQFRDMYPEAMRTVWRLGYDDRNLYLAMHFRVPEGITLKADTKDPADNDNENAVLFGDHVEIQATPHARHLATKQGYGFYKLTINPYDIYADTWWYNGVPGSEGAWGSGATIRSTYDKRNWWLEVAWPLSSMKDPEGEGTIRKADGLSLVLQLVRSGFCAGYAFAGWTPNVFFEWDKFYRIVLDPQAPVMQFDRIGDIVYGKLDARVRMRGAAGERAHVALTVENAEGKAVFRKEETFPLAPGEWAEMRFVDEALDLTDWEEGLGKKRNRLRLVVTAGGKAVYRFTAPLLGHTEAYDKMTYLAYLNTRPKGDYKSRIAYYPVNGKMRVALDLDVMADLPAPVRQARAYRLTVTAQKGGDAIFTHRGEIRNLAASDLLEIGPLEGEYLATLELLGEDGTVVSTREHPFVRHHYPWEGNTIGEERVVVPPFRPIRKEDNVLKTRCAEIAVGPGGLWEGIRVMGTDLLRGPMRIEGRVDGEAVRWKGEAPAIALSPGRTFPPEYDRYAFFEKDCPPLPFEKLPKADGYEATVRANGRLGGLRTEVQARMEYDGFYRIRLALDPEGKAVRVDRLAIVLDLWEKARDLIYMRMGDGSPSVPIGAGEGVVWESGALFSKPTGFKGTFIPALSVTDGFHALQFRATGDEGWLLDDEVSSQALVREDGRLSLVLRIVNAPAVLDARRELEFALLALPAKPKPANWRHKVWERHYAHYAFGWRLYGTGADNWYLPTDEDYRVLGDCLHHPEKHADLKLHPELKNNGERCRNHPVLMYSSTVAVGAPLPAVATYGGQWYGDSNVRFQTGDARVGKRWDLTGRYVWDRDACFSEARPASYDEDLVDNYMWYHKKLITLANTNGTMWDNQEMAWYAFPDTGAYGYVRDDGHLQPTCNIFMRRTLMKRLYTLGWLSGKPPLYFAKAFHQAPFVTLIRGIEGPFYIFTEEGTFFDQFSKDLGFFRTFGGSGAVPFRYDSHWHPPAGGAAFYHRPLRSILAVALLHDHAVDRRMDYDYRATVLDLLNREVGFLDEEAQAEFVPYWEGEGTVDLVRWEKTQNNTLRPEPWTEPGVFASAYIAKKNPGKAVLWLVNATDRTRHVGLRLDTERLIGKSRGGLRELETGEAMRHWLPPDVEASREERHRLWLNVSVAPKDFRALVLE